MAMQVGEHDTGDDVPMSDINTTPLVDVMLVLLIIFLITVEVVIHTIRVKLPATAYEVTQTKPENVSLSVRNGPGGPCVVYWTLPTVTLPGLLPRAVDELDMLNRDVGGVPYDT